MKINTKIRYGLRTMIEISKAPASEGVLQKNIALNQNLSLKYLDPIISSLKLKGLIVNLKGKGSGYVLTRPAAEITMYDIYTSFEQVIVIECVNGVEFCDRCLKNCKGRSFWVNFREDYAAILKKYTLEQILEEKYTD